MFNFGSEHARDLNLVPINYFLGMRNPLGPFSDTTDCPEWPNSLLWLFWPVKMAKFVTLVQNMLET